MHNIFLLFHFKVIFILFLITCIQIFLSECAHVHWYLRKTEDSAGSLGSGFTDGGEVPGSV